MKALYQFLIICLVFLFSSQQCNVETDNMDVSYSDCMNRKAETSGSYCCYYNGTWKSIEGISSNCSEFTDDEAYGHVKEVKKKLLAGTYWNKITTDKEIMSDLYYFGCNKEGSNNITIGLLTFVSLLFLLL